VSSEAPAAALEVLRGIVAKNKDVAKSGPARRIATSRHYALLRYWFHTCFGQGRQLAPDDVAGVASHIDAICRSGSMKGSAVVEWWRTILALVAPPGSEGVVGTDAVADWWIQLSPRRHKAALDALGGLDPGSAKESLKRHWSELSPADQFIPLVALRGMFSLEDEEFLRGAAESKSKRQREVAAEIRCSIRGSTLAETLWGDIGAGFSLRGGSVAIVPPKRYTPAMGALGVSKKSGWPDLSDQESWLQKCLYHLACGYWSDALNTSPADLLRAMLSSRIHNPYLSALRFSTIASRDQVWARAFIDNEDLFRVEYGDRSDAEQKTMKPVWYCNLASVLPPAEREVHLERVIESLPWLTTFDDAPLLIWSKEFSGGALRGGQRAGYFSDISSREEAFLSSTTMEPLAWHLSSASGDVLDELASGGEGSKIVAAELKLAVKERDEIRASFGGR
jgi:hypothetical protein